MENDFTMLDENYVRAGRIDVSFSSNPTPSPLEASTKPRYRRRGAGPGEVIPEVGDDPSNDVGAALENPVGTVDRGRGGLDFLEDLVEGDERPTLRLVEAGFDQGVTIT
jgi:hypothetical protein